MLFMSPLLILLFFASSCDQQESGCETSSGTASGEFGTLCETVNDYSGLYWDYGTYYAVEVLDQCHCLSKARRFGVEAEQLVVHEFCSQPCGSGYGYCPPESLCVTIFAEDSELPDPALGRRYCIPICIEDGCPFYPEETCTPPTEGDPWKWECRGAS